MVLYYFSIIMLYFIYVEEQTFVTFNHSMKAL